MQARPEPSPGMEKMEKKTWRRNDVSEEVKKERQEEDKKKGRKTVNTDQQDDRQKSKTGSVVMPVVEAQTIVVPHGLLLLKEGRMTGYV